MKVGDKVKIVSVTDGDCNGHRLNDEGIMSEICSRKDPLCIRVRFGLSNGCWFRRENIEIL